MDVPALTDDDLRLLAEPTLTTAKAALLCRHSIYAYFGRRELSKVFATVPWDGFSTWDRKQNQGHIAWDKSCVVIAFRGTDSKEDWAKNAKALWPRRHVLGGKVHRGFREVSEQVKSYVMRKLQDIGGGERLVLLTGHSLGGAVATEFAASLYAKRPSWLRDIQVVTFGGPRLGDPRFETQYENLAGDSHWWFVNSGDPVPHLPPKVMGYRHCGHLYWFNKLGKLIDIGEREIGLEASTATGERRKAIEEYESLEASLPDIMNEEEYTKYLDTIAEEVGSVTEGITLGENGHLSVAVQEGELQGRVGGWLASQHRLGLYYERVESI